MATANKPSAKPLRLRAAAVDDVRYCAAQVREQAGSDTAARWIDALQLAFAHISHAPTSGDADAARAMQIPGLRVWRVHGQPSAVWAIERNEHVDVLRVLKQHQG
jgi:toxin ParE1/3/4